MAATVKIPKKSLFKVNEVCSITGVKPYVLRFWENEFEEIAPIVSSLGQKLYSAKDVEFIALVKKLLFQNKMTVEKAKAHIRSSNLTELLAENVSATASPQEAPVANPAEAASKGPKIPSSEKVDLEKLFMAKERLEKILSVTNTLKQRNNWTAEGGEIPDLEA